MAGNIIQEFLVALGYTVDRNKERAAIDSARRVEQTVRRSDEAATRSTVIGSNRRRIEMDRERGVRTRGAASYIAELRQRQQAEKVNTDNSIKAIARRGLAEAKTTAERARWTQKLNQVERQEERERTKESAAGLAARTAAMSAYTSGIGHLVTALSGLAAIGAGAFGAIAKASEKLEGTFYTSKRTGSSAEGIRAFSFAAEQTGSTSKEAIGALEELAHKMKAMPGYNTMLEGLGVPSRDENGRVVEFTERLMKLGDVMAKMPEPKRYAHGEALGLPTHLTQSITDPEFRKAYRQQREMMAKAGLDPAQADRDSKAFMDAWRRTTETIGIIGTKVQGALVNAFGDKVREFGDFLLQNADPIAKGVVRVGEAFLKLVEGVANLVKGAGSDEAKAALKGFTESIDLLALALGGLALALTTRLLSPLGKVLGLLTTLGAPSPPAWLLAMLGVGAAAQTSTAIAKGGLPAGVDPITGRAPTDEVGSGLIEPGKEGGVQRWLREKYDGAKRAIGGTAVGRALGIGQGGGTDGAGAADAGQFNARTPEAAGTYRPQYQVGDADLDQRVINTIAGEVSTRNGEGVDAVVNNMLNRVGSKAWGPSGNLLEVARAPGQYAGYRQASEKESEFIRSRIRTVASGGVPDNTGGSNSYRAETYYRGEGADRTWARTSKIGPNVGGNRYAFVPGASNGPYAPYKDPKPQQPSPTPPESPTVAKAPSMILAPPPVPEWLQRAREEQSKGLNRPPVGTPANDAGPQVEPWNAASMFNAPPLGGGVSSNVSNTSTVINLNGDRNVNVTGVSDPKEAALYADLAASRRDADLFRNMRSNFA